MIEQVTILYYANNIYWDATTRSTPTEHLQEAELRARQKGSTRHERHHTATRSTTAEQNDLPTVIKRHSSAAR